MRPGPVDVYTLDDFPRSEALWGDGLSAEELAEVLRTAMRDEYANASSEAMGDALGNVLDSMSAAEAFNFTSSLNRLGKTAGQVLSDPTFQQVARAALPIAGTLLAGPAGAALGNLAASALPQPAQPPTAPRPAAGAPAPSAPTPGPAALPPPTPAVAPEPSPAALPGPVAPVRPSPLAGGSPAAAQAFVLASQRDVLGSLLATALGHHGCQQVSGVPVAQVINLFSQVLGQAAADADELMYSRQQSGASESVLEDGSAGSLRSLYIDLLGTDNLELAEAAALDGFDR